jgi:hypothetical protein
MFQAAVRTAEESEFDSWQRKGIFYSPVPRGALGPTHAHLKWVNRAILTADKSDRIVKLTTQLHSVMITMRRAVPPLPLKSSLRDT